MQMTSRLRTRPPKHSGWSLSEEELALDARLARLGRGLGALRLRMGEGLGRLEAVGGVQALGFPTLESYAREALGRSGRWAADVRSLARRLAGLPEVRRALVSGRLTTSMVELVAKVATPEDEATWVERAAGMTVRALRAEVKRERVALVEDEAPGRVTVTTTVDRVEAWAFEQARLMVEAVGATRGEGIEPIEAMLAEGLTEMLARGEEIDLPSTLTADYDAEERAWRAELAAIREAAEAAVEGLTQVEAVAGVEACGDVVGAEAIADAREDAREIDARLRELGAELARRDLELGSLGRVADERGVWRALGYVTFDHYCRERIGLSPSSMAGRVALARRVGELPEVAVALKDGHIGFEAAAAIARVAGRATVEAWVERAKARTVKLLREEIDAVEMVARAEGMELRTMAPPDAAMMEDVRAIERAVIGVVSGVVEPEGIAGRMSGGEGAGRMSGSGCDGDEGDAQEPVAPEGDVGPERVARELETALRLSMSESTGRFWRALEGMHAASEDGGSFVAFLVRAVKRAWSGARAGDVAYADVYRRDRWRCACPVCRSRNVTPHHVRFRSRGGGEERGNLISLCERCHLSLVHEGRLTVEGTAPDGLVWRAAGWSA